MCTRGSWCRSDRYTPQGWRHPAIARTHARYARRNKPQKSRRNAGTHTRKPTREAQAPAHTIAQGWLSFPIENSAAAEERWSLHAFHFSSCSSSGLCRLQRGQAHLAGAGVVGGGADAALQRHAACAQERYLCKHPPPPSTGMVGTVQNCSYYHCNNISLRELYNIII